MMRLYPRALLLWLNRFNIGLQRCYNHRAVVVLMVAMVLTATALTDG
jgi:hypothetical protein